MAEYAGISALNQLSGKKFDERVEKYLSIIRSPGELLFDPGGYPIIRARCWCWRPTCGDQPGAWAWRGAAKRVSDFSRALDAYAQEPDMSSLPHRGISQLLSEFRAARAAMFDGFWGARREKTSGSYAICGYDPMNMIKSEGRVLCKTLSCLRRTAKRKRGL